MEQFTAWGTYVHLDTTRPEDQAAAGCVARALLDAVDRACSRFRPDSDLVRVNRQPGRWVRVDPVLVSAVRAALFVADDTGGLVDPLLGRPLSWLGYDRDLATLQDLEAAEPTSPAPAATYGAWQEVRTTADAVRIPPGTALDLGSIGKAWAADLIASTWADRGIPGVVSLGGDLAIAGEASWPVLVRERPSDAEGAVVRLGSGGLATSSVLVRRWRARRDGGTVERHHLLDPRTGAPTRGPWRTVTATGPTCSAANAASTATLVLGADGPAWLAARGVDARLVAEDGTVHHTGSWPAPEEAA